MTKDHHKREEWEGELTNRQRNIVFPDTVRNWRSVDALLWKGNPHATRVQRIGIAIFATSYLLMGAAFVYGAAQTEHPEQLFLLLIALPPLYLGGRMLRNTFLRPPSKSDQE